METFGASGLGRESDAMLVTATKHGDALAFETLVLRYRPRILAIAQRITKNREDAEDVAQESLQKAFRHLHAFEEKARFSTWVTRIAMNEALMLLRRKRAAPEVLPETPEDREEFFSARFVDQRPSPEESCRLRERKEILSNAIDRLGPKIRRAILLRDIEERSAEETAQILGTSISAVKARVFQGRRKLRSLVNPAVLGGVSTAEPTEAHIC